MRLCPMMLRMQSSSTPFRSCVVQFSAISILRYYSVLQCSCQDMIQGIRGQIPAVRLLLYTDPPRAHENTPNVLVETWKGYCRVRWTVGRCRFGHVRASGV